MVHAHSTERAILPDWQLVDHARCGVSWAREQLFRRHLRATRGLAFRLLGAADDVDDVVQETFVEALSSLDRLRDARLFGTWLGRITINMSRRAILRRQRARRRSDVIDAMDRTGLIASSAPPEIVTELRNVYGILDSLAPNLRIAFVLRRVEGKELQDIADVMNASLSSVKRWLAKAERLFNEVADGPAEQVRR